MSTRPESESDSDQRIAMAMLKWLRANADRDVGKRDELELAIGILLQERMTSIHKRYKVDV